MPPKSKTTKKKKPAAGSAKKKSLGYPARAVIAALVLCAFLVVGLVALSQFGRHVSPILSPDEVAERHIAPEDIRVEIDSLLLHAAIPLSQVEPLDGPGLLVRAQVPDDAALEALQRRLQRLDPRLALDLRLAASTVEVLRQGEILYFVRFQPLPAPPSPPVPLRPRVAIVMDDLGRDMATGRALVEMAIPITFSILPGERNAARVAELAHRHGREVLIHIPMEPQGYPLVDPGDDALLVDFTADDLRARMRGFMARVPHATGANNHMGSRFTESTEAMLPVLNVMRESNLFFLDSVTTSRSVGFKEARRLGIPAAKRDVFLDNVVEEGAIAEQVRKLAERALRHGSAIGICHPYPATLAVLARQGAEFEKLGIDVVPVSELLVR